MSGHSIEQVQSFLSVKNEAHRVHKPHSLIRFINDDFNAQQSPPSQAVITLAFQHVFHPNTSIRLFKDRPDDLIGRNGIQMLSWHFNREGVVRRRVKKDDPSFSKRFRSEITPNGSGNLKP
jgi:hypothetical protein